MTGNSPYDLTQYQSETNAFQVNSYLFQGMGDNGAKYGIPVWDNAWAKVDKKLPPLEQSRSTSIDQGIASGYKDAYGRPITSTNQGSVFTHYGVSRK